MAHTRRIGEVWDHSQLRDVVVVGVKPSEKPQLRGQRALQAIVLQVQVLQPVQPPQLGRNGVRQGVAEEVPGWWT